MRAKRILGIKNINIYALGIYVDDVAAKRLLAGRFKGAREEALSKDQRLFDGQYRLQISNAFQLHVHIILIKCRYRYGDHTYILMYV